MSITKAETTRLLIATVIVSFSSLAARAQESQRDAVAGTSSSTPQQSGNSADSSAATIDEIVVTATRKSEPLLNVPLSITAVTSDALTNKAAQNFFDYATSVPNLSFGMTGYGVTSARTVAIRGIADAGTTALYLDDTPVPESLDPKVVNIDRVEVLRGPQGTLYGARSMGGAVRLITVQPDANTLAGHAHAQLSDTDSTDRANWQVDGAINLPIAEDTAGIRLVGIRTYDAGFITRQFPTTTGMRVVDNVGSNESTGASAALLIKPTSDLSITPRILYQRTSYDGFPYADVAVADPLVPTILEPRSLTVQREFDIPEAAVDQFVLTTLDAQLTTSLGTLTSSTSYFEREVRNVGDNTLAITSLFGLVDDQGFPLSSVVFDDREPSHSFTEEVRFTSDFDGPLQITAGAYYNKVKSRIIFMPTPVDGLGPNGETANLYSRFQISESKELAGYAEGTLNITDNLLAIAGVRAFRNSNSFEAVLDGVGNGGLFVQPRVEDEETGFTPKFSLQYRWPDMQVYVTAAKGFRPGAGQVPITSPVCDDDLAALGLNQEDTERYRADTVWSYEIGSKGSFLDRRLTISTAAFRIDWSDIQQTQNLLCGFPFTTNAGEARSQGVELEIGARPIDGLSIDVGFGYTDAEFTEGTEFSIFRKGDRVTQVPRYSFSVAADYSHPLSDRVEGFLHADYEKFGSSPTAVNAVRDPVTDVLVARIRPKYQLLNLRAGFAFDRYEVAVFGRNVTNEIASLSDVTDLGIEAQGRARVAINRPRTIGLEMSAKF